MYTTTITQKGQVTVPLPYRTQLNIQPGQHIRFIPHDTNPRQLIIEPVIDLLSLQGVIKTNKKFSKTKARKVYEQHIVKEFV